MRAARLHGCSRAPRRCSGRLGEAGSGPRPVSTTNGSGFSYCLDGTLLMTAGATALSLLRLPISARGDHGRDAGICDTDRPCRPLPGDRWYVDETYVKISGRS